MSKRISKKILYLFLVATTLLQCGSTAPMLGEITHSSDPCQKPSTGTKITDLPLDCFHEIFRYLALKSDYKTELYDTKPMLKLRFVCKEFRQGVKSFPGHLSVSYKNRNIIPLGNVFDNVQWLNLTNCDFKSSIVVWPTNLRGLGLYKCRNIDNISIPKANNLRELTMGHCDKFNGKVLAAPTNLCELSIMNCYNFKGSGLEKLINLHTLTVTHCLHFDWGKLEKLTNLCKLVVTLNQTLDVKKLEKLTNFRELVVNCVYFFDETGLQKLTKLRKLVVQACHNFDENSDTVEKLKENGCKVTVVSDILLI